MKKEIAKTALWVIVSITYSGLWRFAQYQIDMAYSTIATQQLESDAAYGWLRFYRSITSILTIVSILLYIFFVYMIWRVWQKKFNT